MLHKPWNWSVRKKVLWGRKKVESPHRCFRAVIERAKSRRNRMRYNKPMKKNARTMKKKTKIDLKNGLCLIDGLLCVLWSHRRDTEICRELLRQGTTQEGPTWGNAYIDRAALFKWARPSSTSVRGRFPSSSSWSVRWRSCS